jgi:hypothetical protein
MDIKEIEWETVDWTHLAQYGTKPSSSTKGREFFD